MKPLESRACDSLSLLQVYEMLQKVQVFQMFQVVRRVRRVREIAWSTLEHTSRDEEDRSRHASCRHATSAAISSARARSPLSRGLFTLLLAAALALSMVSPPALAQAPAGSATLSEPQSRQPEPSVATPLLRSAREWIPGGGRLDWSAQGDKLAFDRAGADGFFDIHVRDVEGEFDRCLTCEIYEFRASHCLDPVWHPSGEYLVLTVQRNAKKLANGELDLFGAGRAPFADLWVLRADGKAFWQLTRVAEQGSAILTPSFDHEGNRLAWSERTTTRRGGAAGAYRLRSAELVFRRGTPALKRADAHALPSDEALILLGSFTPDDQAVLVAANLNAQSERGLDVYRVPLDGGKSDRGDALRLTHTSGGLDLAARVSPRSSLIAWPSAAEVRARPVGRRLQATELWLMASDGSDKIQLTRFNNALSDEYRGSTAVGDFAWSPDATRIAVQVLSGHNEPKGDILLLDLSPVSERALGP